VGMGGDGCNFRPHAGLEWKYAKSVAERCTK